MENGIDKSLIKDDKKIEALEFILENVFRSGFGMLNKTELDVILFATVMKYGESDELTDLELSKKLQITQRKLQNLKEKVSVKYLQISKEDAIKEFINKLSHAKKDDIYIDVPIRNIAVKNEMEGILDENDILLHSQLNTKIFRVRLDDLLELIILLETIDNENVTINDIKIQIIEKLKTREGKLLEINDEISLTEEDEIYPSFKNKLLKTSIDSGLELIKAFVPGGGVAATIIEKLIHNFGANQDV